MGREQLAISDSDQCIKLLLQTRITSEAGTRSAVTAVWQTHIKLNEFCYGFVPIGQGFDDTLVCLYEPEAIHTTAVTRVVPKEHGSETRNTQSTCLFQMRLYGVHIDRL